MRRRRYLACLGATGLAGCVGEAVDLGGDTPDATPASTPTPRPSPSPTQTISIPPTATRTSMPTPTSTARPRTIVSTATLVYRWGQFGDVLANAIDGAGAGVTILLAARFGLTARDSEIDGRVQFAVTDEAGDKRADEGAAISELVAEDGTYEYEQGVPVDTSGWGTGQYTLEAIAKDDHTDTVSDPVTTTFRLREPLTATEASLRAVEAPSTVAVGEPYQFEIEVANTSGQDNSLQTSLSVRVDDSAWDTYTDDQLKVTIPAGGTNTWQSAAVAFDRPGTYAFRLDRLDATWTVDVTR